MTSALKTAEINGFKSISNASVEFSQKNAIVGLNGAGKSNLCAFFEMLNYSMTGSLQKYIGSHGYANQILYRGSSVTRELSAKLKFDTDSGPNTYSINLVPATGGILIYTEEECSYHAPGYDRPYKESIGTGGHSESGLVNTSRSGTQEYIFKLLSRTRFYQFHDTSMNSRIRSGARLDGPNFLFSDAGNLASVLFYIRENFPDTLEHIEHQCREALPFFKSFYLEPDSLNANMIFLRAYDKFNSDILEPGQFSDGSLRFIAITTLLNMPEFLAPNILIIDEPELGLHPNAIDSMLDQIRGNTFSQIILSTQSGRIARDFSGNLIVADTGPVGTTFRSMPPSHEDEWLDGFLCGDLWEKR